MNEYGIRFFRLDKRAWDKRLTHVMANNLEEAISLAKIKGKCYEAKPLLSWKIIK